jgi:shikimate kinase
VATSNLILIGYRGCGKSSVGRRLATRLGWAFVDTDELIEAATGKSIRAIFEQEGEASFRQREAAIFEQEGEASFRQREAVVVAQVASGTRQVVSVGGGAVLVPENRAHLQAAGLCVWLTAPAEELLRRIQADPRSVAMRPALTAASALDEIRHLLGQREPLYASLAEHVVQTGGQSVEQVTDAVQAVMAEGRASAEAP